MGRAIDRPGLGAARLGALALFAVALGQPATAREPLVAPMPIAQSPEATAAPSLPDAVTSPGTQQCPAATTGAGHCIPALTPVRLVLRAHLGSKISASGQVFPIALAAPIVVDGKELIPAGTSGMGEVVHAKNSGGSGASGELVLAARYLELGGRRLRLRSLNFAAAGQDKLGTVQTLNIASAATVPALALIGFFIKGKGIDLPDGVEAMAKTAEPFVLDQPPTALTEPASVPPPPEQGATS